MGALHGQPEAAATTSISEAAYQRLRSLIVSRELPPGTLATERKLADAPGASRMPLRAAINRLEGEAAALSAERMSPAAAAELVARSRAIAADPAIDVERFWIYDDAFHRALARGSGKPQLARIFEKLRGRARMCHLKTIDLHFAPQAGEHLPFWTRSRGGMRRRRGGPCIGMPTG